MILEDILATLQHHGMIHIDDDPDELEAKGNQDGDSHSAGAGGMGRNALALNTDKSQDAIIPEHYEILWDREAVRAHLERYAAKGYLELKPEHLKYTPFLVTRITLGKDGMLHTLAMAKGQAVEVQGKEPDLVSASLDPTTTDLAPSTGAPTEGTQGGEAGDGRAGSAAMEVDNPPSFDLKAASQSQISNTTSPHRGASIASSTPRKQPRTPRTPSRGTPRTRRSAHRDTEATSTLSPVRSSLRSGAS